MMLASSDSISSDISAARSRRNPIMIPIIRPLRFNIPSKARPPDGRTDTIPGVGVIRSPGPTVSIRPANLLYRAPAGLHGAASHLLRQILRTSSPTASPTTKPLLGSPVKYLSLPTKGSRESHGLLSQSDAILYGFLLNNGGYLDDSDSEGEAETPSDCHTPDSLTSDLSMRPARYSPNQTTKPISQTPKSRNFLEISTDYF